METSVVLEVDDRGRISVGKLLGGAERVIATQIAPGRIVIETAVVVRAMVPLMQENVEVVAQIDASFGSDQIFVKRQARKS